MQDQQEPSIDQLIDTMEAMMQASYFTPDQLARLKERHRQVGGEGFTRWQRQWAQLAEEAEATSSVEPIPQMLRCRTWRGAGAT